MSSLPKVSAIILNYNKDAYTAFCIEGLCRTSHRPLEIVLVDNGSERSPAEWLPPVVGQCQQSGIELKFIRNESHRGAPAARNQAIEVASGEWLVFLDNDAVPFSSSWLSSLLEESSRIPDAGAISPVLLYPFPPHRIQFAGCAVSTTGRVQYLGRGAEADQPEFATTREVQCLISACLLTPRKILLTLGGFDEIYHPVQYEDLDLCYRIRERGGKCYVVGRVRVYHFENTTTDGSADINFRYVTIKNGLTFKKRWRHRFGQENGPEDATIQWANVERRTLSDLGPGWSPWV